MQATVIATLTCHFGNQSNCLGCLADTQDKKVMWEPCLQLGLTWKCERSVTVCDLFTIKVRHIKEQYLFV